MFQSYTDFACFGITIELTDEGVNHTDDIVACVFAYVGELGPRQYLHWQGCVMQPNTAMSDM